MTADTERRILVTGAGGFIGQWAVKALRSTPGVMTRRNAVDLLNGDASGEIAKFRPDTILHIAWSVKHG
jgi:nucleoside-diphosphate-sugar epimerase